jgi:hypothetical protein
MTVTSLSDWKLLCPYGKWTCADGREVLFNRQYHPILERQSDLAVRTANPSEWVAWKTQDFFFDDGQFIESKFGLNENRTSMSRNT